MCSEGAAALYPVSSGADPESVYRAAGLRSHRRADESRVLGRAGLRALSTLSRGSGGGSQRRARTGGCDIHSALVVAARRSIGAVQAAGLLLVARQSGRCYRRPIGLRFALPYPREPADVAASDTRSLAR